MLFGTTSHAGLAGTRAVTNAVQSLASSQATAGVRFFVAANQEGGQVQQLQGAGFAAIPAALDQGQVTPGTLQRLAASWGRQLRAAGVNLDLAPVMDVVPAGTDRQNAPIGLLQREFGHDPGTVAAHGVAFARGMGQAGVATTAKHFPGLGRVRGNTDFTSGVVDTVTSPQDSYLQSFRAAIGAGVPFVMISLATYTRIDPHHLAVFSARVMGTILRQQIALRGRHRLGRHGRGLGGGRGVPRGPGDRLPRRGRGPDHDGDRPGGRTRWTVPCCSGPRRTGRSAGRSDAAVMRVLAAKQAYGLLPCSG